jgi:hypothetical protein
MADYVTRHGGCIHADTRIEQIELSADNTRVATLCVSQHAAGQDIARREPHRG